MLTSYIMLFFLFFFVLFFTNEISVSITKIKA